MSIIISMISLLVEHEMQTASVRMLPSCWMTISIAELLSAIHSDTEPGHASVHTVPWVEWGPATMHILLNIHPDEVSRPLLDHRLIASHDTQL
jgi:hypothetical protein